MSDPHVTDRLTVSSDSSLPSVAAVAIVAWLALEFALRRGLGSVLTDVLGTGVGAEALIMVVPIPLVAVAIAWWGMQNGIEPTDWDYDLSLKSVGSGLAGGVAHFAVYLGLLAVLTTLLGYQLPTDASVQAGADAPTWAIALFVLGNGVAVPIAEELAWRGVVQTALIDAYGTWVAVVVTAMAFVAKHLVVDLGAPLFRVTALVVLAFVLCGLRARYGTASSTVAHVVVNVPATATIVLV